MIAIKPCDKGAGNIIVDHAKYVLSCQKELESVTKNGDHYYKEISPAILEKAKQDIDDTLTEALKSDIISKPEFDAMSAKDKKPGKFYQLFKIHKKFEEPNLPPGRPIISGCGSITENISLFVDHHAKDLVPKIPSFLQDTPYLLRELETLKTTNIPPNTFPISVDLVGLYTNIPHDEDIDSLKSALDKRKNVEVSSDFLVKLLSLVLKYNIFEFNGKYYQQKIGTAMGT